MDTGAWAGQGAGLLQALGFADGLLWATAKYYCAAWELPRRGLAPTALANMFVSTLPFWERVDRIMLAVGRFSLFCFSISI